MDIAKLTASLAGSVKTVDTLMGAAEAIVLAVVGRVASWVASVPCAVMTARASMEIFNLSWPLAVVVAIALELVGQTTSNLWLNAKSWNATRRKSDPSANVALVFGLMVSYFVIDTAIVIALVVPDFLATSNWRLLVAIFYPIVAVIATVALNERMAQYKREADVTQEKQSRNQRRKSGRKTQADQPELRPAGYAEVSGGTRERALTILAERPGISGSELGRELGRSERLGRKLKTELLPETRGNGKGAR